MVKSRSGSSDVMSSTYVPMIGCFVAGFVTNRLLNHQNVVTGELEEGSDEGVKIGINIFVVVVTIVAWFIFGYWLEQNKHRGDNDVYTVWWGVLALGVAWGGMMYETYELNNLATEGGWVWFGGVILSLLLTGSISGGVMFNK